MSLICEIIYTNPRSFHNFIIFENQVTGNFILNKDKIKL